MKKINIWLDNIKITVVRIFQTPEEIQAENLKKFKKNPEIKAIDQKEQEFENLLISSNLMRQDYHRY